MDTNGQHLIIDAFECQNDILNDAVELEQLLTGAINKLGMEILSSHFHSFIPEGVTGIIGISTSHFSIHTWPEHRYAALDLYTCGDQNIWPAFREILQILQAKQSDVYEISRGQKINNNTAFKKFTLTFNESNDEIIESQAFLQ
ncbi:adenosylmethionine decarboxylase [Psychrobacillus sp. NEAU-3TGS]|uniref:adenosylmethionine decarboxylase n=1 Tax=Psychrobacillus sp. NEAU-3TGS TaxID=2995412 RepID=UPI002498FD14|nr:adenosylmethionine decarboxylase [Psychrobacillus sp. NEAU-3TGS]MDI2588955.1 adenosylmethionine decarboxylase [Psychrobacillus sp. NEAU-3TGS]